VKRKSQTKSLELFAPRPAAPFIDAGATLTAKLLDEIRPRGVLVFSAAYIFASRLLNRLIAESGDAPYFYNKFTR
jgi:hypothetical protein